MSTADLLIELRNISISIAAGDSFEGSLEYLMPAPLVDEVIGAGSTSSREDWEAADFAVVASYRIGNRDGQGGLHTVGEMAPC